MFMWLIKLDLIYVCHLVYKAAAICLVLGQVIILCDLNLDMDDWSLKISQHNPSHIYDMVLLSVSGSAAGDISPWSQYHTCQGDLKWVKWPLGAALLSNGAEGTVRQATCRCPLASSDTSCVETNGHVGFAWGAAEPEWLVMESNLSGIFPWNVNAPWLIRRCGNTTQQQSKPAQGSVVVVVTVAHLKEIRSEEAFGNTVFPAYCVLSSH